MDGKYLIRVGLSKGAHISQPGDIETLADRTPEEIQYHLAQGHIVIEPAPLDSQGKPFQGKPHPVQLPEEDRTSLGRDKKRSEP